MLAPLSETQRRDGAVLDVWVNALGAEKILLGHMALKFNREHAKTKEVAAVLDNWGVAKLSDHDVDDAVQALIGLGLVMHDPVAGSFPSIPAKAALEVAKRDGTALRSARENLPVLDRDKPDVDGVAAERFANRPAVGKETP